MGHKPHQRAKAATEVPRDVAIARADTKRAERRCTEEQERANAAIRRAQCAEARAEDLQRLLDAAVVRINKLEAQQQPSVACGHDVDGGAKMLCGCILIEDRSQCDTPDHPRAILEVVRGQVA